MQLIELLVIWSFALVIMVLILFIIVAVLTHEICCLNRKIANLRENTIDAFGVVTKHRTARR